MKSARIDLRLVPAQKERWENYAEDRGLDLSQLIRQAVEEYMDIHVIAKKVQIPA